MVPSVSGPLDQPWSTGAWDGALDQRTDRPNLGSTGAWDGALGVLVPEPGRQLNPLNPREQLNPLDSQPQPSGNFWDVYRTEK